MFGASAVLSKCVLPSVMRADVIRLLQMWDYEAGLGDQERSAILGALQREVVRVHKQLQLAAAELRSAPGGGQQQQGAGQLAALQSWDVAYAQVMLAQQRTITALIESVNAAQIAAQRSVQQLLVGRSPPGRSTSGDAHCQQEAVMAGYRLERCVCCWFILWVQFMNLLLLGPLLLI